MIATIDIHKESLHFACAHFTILGSNRRENLHGHNYFVRAVATGKVDDNGLCFDYNTLKKEIEALCQELDETTLLPSKSPYLDIERSDKHVTAVFGDERIQFLNRDVLLLPIRNVTVEELATWFLDQLTARDAFRGLAINELVLTISSGPSQSASVSWITQ
ncbi:MAG: 6-carboxytetrahydropterin synthase [Gammaproteobacteria bacterium]|nr:6-carboxytetrahydropterin synthase [Gammaproteobacteria bacterium]